VPVPSTWNERELPLLEAVYQGEEAGEEMLTTKDAARAAGIDPDVAARAMRGLNESGYVTGHRETSVHPQAPTWASG
jgi:DNA-binding transcriptional regulator YhcF (GntR family)